MLTDVDKKVPKSSEFFCCDICDYITSRKSQYMRHLLTPKHKNVDKPLTNVYKKVPKSSTPIQNSFSCICGKTFGYRQSLSVHKKKCNYTEHGEVKMNEPINTEVVMQLIKQNQDLQEILHDHHTKMYDLAKEGKYITNNTTNNFNLNVFLNEQCKDAINIMDFVDSLNVQLKDLEHTSRVGYAEGVSQIFTKALSDLTVHTRPIHCSDSKRDVLYIKDGGFWYKDDEDNSKLTRAIKIVGNKNIQKISEWQKVYPEYNDPESKQNDHYMKMICNAMSGSTKEEANRNYEKIVKNIAKGVVIDKSN